MGTEPLRSHLERQLQEARVKITYLNKQLKAVKQLEELKKKVKELEDNINAPVEPRKVKLKGNYCIYSDGITGVRAGGGENAFGNVFLTAEAANTAVGAMRKHNRIIAYILQHEVTSFDYDQHKRDHYIAYNVWSDLYYKCRVETTAGDSFNTIYMSEGLADKLLTDIKSGVYTL